MQYHHLFFLDYKFAKLHLEAIQYIFFSSFYLFDILYHLRISQTMPIFLTRLIFIYNQSLWSDRKKRIDTDAFLHILNSRLVHHRQHFLWLRFGGRQKTSTKPRFRNNCFCYCRILILSIKDTHMRCFRFSLLLFKNF